MASLTAPPRRLHLLGCAIAWTAFAVYGSLVPLMYHSVELADAVSRFRNLPPLGTGLGTRADLVANLLLFIPLTWFWMGALVLDRSRSAAWLAAAVLVPLAAVAAVSLEFTQIWFQGRTVSRNDIVAESVGGFVGVLLWLTLGDRIVGWLRSAAREWTSPRSALRTVLDLYVVGLAIYSVMPLDLTISVSDLYDKFRRGSVLVVPFSYSYENPATVVYQFFVDIAVFLPVGAWVVVRWRALVPAWSAATVAAVGGSVAALVIEFAQLLVLSRFTDSTDVLLGTVGAAFGGWWTARSSGRNTTPVGRSANRLAFRWVIAIAGYSLLLVVAYLYPFELTSDRDVIRARYLEFFRLPFLSLYQGSEFNAMGQVLFRFLTFVPLGLAVGRVAALTRGQLLRGAVVVLGLVYSGLLGLGIEMVQVLMPARIADATEVAFCWLGVVAGFVASRRLFPAPESQLVVPGPGRTE